MLLVTGLLASPLEARAQPVARVAHVGYVTTSSRPVNVDAFGQDTLAINAKTTKTLGLRMAPSLLSRADRILQ